MNAVKNLKSSYRFIGWTIAIVGLGFWAYGAWRMFDKWYWDEPPSLTDLGVLVFCVATGGLLIRGAQDAYRRIKSDQLALLSVPPESATIKPFKTGLNAKLILTVTDKTGFTADPLVYVETVLRDDKAFWLVGKLDLGGKKRRDVAISTTSLTKIKDVETNVVIHQNFRTWISQRLDGWSD